MRNTNQAGNQQSKTPFDKSNIFCTVMNKERNKDLLKSIPFTPFFDMAVVYRYLVNKEEHGIASILITNEMVEKYHINREPLLSESIKNTELLFPAKVESIDSIIHSILSSDGALTSEEQGLFLPPGKGTEAHMYVATNDIGIHGAGVLLYPDIIHGIATKMKSSVYLIPSSIHEVIIAKADGITLDAITQMVQDVNNTAVAPEEILSDRAWFFEWKANEMEGCEIENFIV